MAPDQVKLVEQGFFLGIAAGAFLFLIFLLFLPTVPEDEDRGDDF